VVVGVAEVAVAVAVAAVGQASLFDRSCSPSTTSDTTTVEIEFGAAAVGSVPTFHSANVHPHFAQPL